MNHKNLGENENFSRSDNLKNSDSLESNDKSDDFAHTKPQKNVTLSAEQKADAHFAKMTQTPVHKLVLSLSVPTTITMLVTSIYNTADTFFVSQLGTSAAGAVAVVFSLMSIIQALGFMVGMGTGNLVARALGAKKYDEATKIASTGFFIAMALGTCICLFGLIFINPLVDILGATTTIKPYAIEYITYILMAAPFMCTSFVMNNILRGQGKASIAMIGSVTGGLLNIALDPLMIFTLGLGVSGAAIATAISQLVSFSLLLSMFVKGKSDAQLKFNSISRNFYIYRDIIKTGSPSFYRQSAGSVAAAATNWQARIYGDAAVAAMGINSRIFILLYSVLLGLGQGMQPVVGFNYGAKLYKRVRDTISYTVRSGTVLMVCVSVLGFVFADDIIKMFISDDASVLTIGVFAFRAQCLVISVQGLCLPLIMSLQCTGRTMASSFLGLCRQFFCFMPIIAVLPFLFGLRGVQLALPLADLLTFAICIPVFIAYLRDLKRLEASNCLT